MQRKTGVHEISEERKKKKGRRAQRPVAYFIDARCLRNVARARYAAKNQRVAKVSNANNGQGLVVMFHQRQRRSEKKKESAREVMTANDRIEEKELALHDGTLETTRDHQFA